MKLVCLNLHINAVEHDILHICFLHSPCSSDICKPFSFFGWMTVAIFDLHFLLLTFILCTVTFELAIYHYVTPSLGVWCPCSLIKSASNYCTVNLQAAPLYVNACMQPLRYGGGGHKKRNKKSKTRRLQQVLTAVHKKLMGLNHEGAYMYDEQTPERRRWADMLLNLEAGFVVRECQNRGIRDAPARMTTSGDWRRPMSTLCRLCLSRLQHPPKTALFRHSFGLRG